MPEPEIAPDDLVDPDAVQAFAFTVWNYKQGEMVSLMIHLGDRLGIYSHLDGAGPITAAELAQRSGLHERWLLEWLRANAAARLLEYHEGDRFELTDVGALVLARSDSPSFAAAACGEPRPVGFVDRLAEAFESGIGLSYDDLGAETAHHVERMLGPMARALLVPVVIPALDGVQRSSSTVRSLPTSGVVPGSRWSCSPKRSLRRRSTAMTFPNTRSTPPGGASPTQGSRMSSCSAPAPKTFPPSPRTTSSSPSTASTT